MKINNSKENLRCKIKQLRNSYDRNTLESKSEEVFETLEILGIFQEAEYIFIYQSILGEVSTEKFINKWMDKKRLFCPVVIGKELVFREIKKDTQYIVSSFGISEPQGINFEDYAKIDLIVIPGVAFDIQKNRLGYGGGFYDRFLNKIKAPRVGVCFDFQLLDSVPTEPFDKKMDYVLSENNLLW